MAGLRRQAKIPFQTDALCCAVASVWSTQRWHWGKGGVGGTLPGMLEFERSICNEEGAVRPVREGWGREYKGCTYKGYSLEDRTSVRNVRNGGGKNDRMRGGNGKSI